MINLTAKLDNDEFQRKLQEMRNTAFGVTNSIVKETQRIETAWQGVANSLKGSEGIGAKLLQGLKPIIPQVEAIRQGVKGIKVDFENIPTVSPLRSMEETTTSAARGFNALNFATQQLVREVPAATMGLHMFFLAISNNLPYFADAIKQVREENKALAASGKPTTSVFKQITSSLFSWQTALVAGITTLTLYGKEIGNWITSLFKGKKALDASAEATKAFAEAIKDSGLGIGDDIAKAKELSEAYIALGDNLDAKKKFIEDNADALRELAGRIEDVNAADKAFIDQTDKFNSAMEKRSMAAVARSVAEKYYEEAIKNETLLRIGEIDMPWYADLAQGAIDVLPDWYVDLDRKFNDALPDWMKAGVEKMRYGIEAAETEAAQDMKAAAEDAKNIGNKAMEMAKEYAEEANNILKSIGITPTEEADKEEEAERAAREYENKRKHIIALARALGKDATIAEREASIAAMQEGLEKELAQIDHDYAVKRVAIKEREKELTEEFGGQLPVKAQEKFKELYDANTTSHIAARAKAEENAQKQLEKSLSDSLKDMADYYIQYGTLKEKILYTTQKYATLIAEAQNEGQRRALEAERDAILAEYKVQADDWANSLVGMTTAQLNKMLAELQAQVEAKEQAFNALGNSDSEDAKKYRDEITKLKAQIAVLNEELGKTSRNVADKNWDESVQTFQEIARSANEAADGIAELDEDLGNTLRSIAQLASSGLNLVVVIKKITDAAWTGAEAISAMEKASLILAAISATIQVVSTLYSLFRESDEVEETKRQFKELNDELERLHKLARIDSVEGTIFGANTFGNFINNLKAMQDALKDFEASKEAINPIDLNYAFSNMRVKTKDRNWFGEWWYGGDEYDYLGNLMPNLFDEFGNVTLEGLQNLQNSDVWEDLGEENRKLIEQLIADWEDYNAAVEATEKYLSDVFGDLGGDLTDALLDSFKNGTDAAEAFGEATGKILERLAQDIVNMALIQPILDEAEAEVLELQNKLRDGDITYDEYLRQTKAIVDEATNKAKGATEDAYDMYEAAGIEENGSGSSSATSKGFQTMSQETGSELNGRFTDIQGQTHRIAEAVEFCKSLHIENLTQVQSINATVAMIHNDTSLIAQHTRALAQMRDDLASIRRSMDNGAI